MKLKTLIYTTDKTLWVKRDFEAIASIVKNAPDVILEEIKVVYFKLPKKVPTYKAEDGGVYIEWNWIRANCPALSNNTRCLHISTAERKRLGLKHPNPSSELGGAYNRDSDSVFDFVVVADKNTKSYDGMTSFVRIFCHELSHGFSHFRGVVDYTHVYDYSLKNIKGIFYTHSFTMWNKLVAQIETLKLQVLALTNGMDIKNPPNNHPEQESPVSKLYLVAKRAIGFDASPNDLAPDEFGCAETVSMLIKQVVDFPVITGTWTLWDKLRTDTRFELVGIPEAGDIVISPTGTGNGSVTGHTGICGFDGVIMSNDSRKGTFEQNYTEESWKERYMGKGGFPVYYYRLKS